MKTNISNLKCYPAPVIAPTGYKWLTKGSERQRGDKFWCVLSGKWVAVTCWIGRKTDFGSFIRPIPKPFKVMLIVEATIDAPNKQEALNTAKTLISKRFSISKQEILA